MPFDPASAIIAVTATVLIAAATYAVYLKGRSDATSPDYMVDMQEVHNYNMYKNSSEALEQDVEAGDTQQ